MWTVKGKTVAGKDVSIQVAAGKDTEKAFVLALAFQQHGQKDAGDPLTTEAAVEWTSDSIMPIPTVVVLKEGSNYAVDRRVKKGVWERHSQRAFRSLEAAEEAMESAASEFPDDQFRIVETYTVSRVVSITKTALNFVGEKPDEEPKQEADTGEKKVEDKAKPSAKPKTTPNAA